MLKDIKKITVLVCNNSKVQKTKFSYGTPKDSRKTNPFDKILN